MLDLGTEFGMNVEPDGKMRGKVFEGRVEAAVLNEAGTLQRSRMMKGEEPAFEIDPEPARSRRGRGRTSSSRASDLVAPPLVLDPGYQVAVLESRPWGYWRFERSPTARSPTRSPGRPPLRVDGPVRLSEPAGGEPERRLRRRARPSST